MAGSIKTHFVSFAGQEVAVKSDELEIIAPFLLSFKGLLVDNPTDLLDTLVVVKRENGYHVEGARFFDAPGNTLRDVLQCLKFEVIHRFVEVHPEMLWLHAGAAAMEDHAILLCGAWGSGKSTLVGNLCWKGWTYLSDDIVPIDMATDSLTSFPLTPMMRANTDTNKSTPLSPEAISNLKKEIVSLDEERFVQGARHVAAIVFPQYDPAKDEVELTPISPASATLELLRNCLNLRYHREDAVHYLGRLVERMPGYQLRYNHGERAAEILIEAHHKNYL